MPRGKKGDRQGIYFSARRKRRKWMLLMMLLVLVALACIYVLQISSRSEFTEESSFRRAVILDGLSIDYPNESFISSAKKVLSQAGFAVEVYHGENVTLNLLRELPSRNYDLVIFRVHGGRIKQPIGLFIGGGLFIEKCSPSSHKEDVESGYLLLGRPYFSNDTYCVAPPHYITDKLKGSFKGTVIIAASCFTGDDEVLASAFFKRGARAYIGFKGKVSPPYIDAFTIKLLQELYVEKLPLEEAFAEVKAEFRSDPRYGGTPMLYLP